MSTHPRLEARVSALERRQINTDTRIEEVTGDITTSFKQLSGDMTTSFKQVDEYFHQIENRIDKIETTIETNHQSIVLILTQILDRLPKDEK